MLNYPKALITITETTELIHSTVILNYMLGYKIDSNHNMHHPPWRIRLEVKIRKTRREVSTLPKKGDTLTTGSPGKTPSSTYLKNGDQKHWPPEGSDTPKMQKPRKQTSYSTPN